MPQFCPAKLSGSYRMYSNQLNNRINTGTLAEAGFTGTWNQPQ